MIYNKKDNGMFYFDAEGAIIRILGNKKRDGSCCLVAKTTLLLTNSKIENTFDERGSSTLSYFTDSNIPIAQFKVINNGSDMCFHYLYSPKYNLNMFQWYDNFETIPGISLEIDK